MTLLSRAFGRPLLLALPLLTLAACRVEPDSEGAPAGAAPGTTAAVETPTTPAPAAPRTGGPPEPYVSRGACPFECCTYGDWLLETAAPAFPVASTDPAPSFQIPANTRVRADSGNVIVARPGLVVADRPFPVQGTDGAPVVAAGDTLWLLDYIGEGYVHTWYRGQTYETSGEYWPWDPADASAPGAPDYAARRLRDTDASWWVHVTLPDGRAGWVRMDDVEATGDDACA